MRIREVLVPLGVLAILGSMLLPLPAVVIDFLLVVNLIGALVLVTSALYVANPLRISTLPSLLLLATLFRLALNVSTTRMILGKGEAGYMIKTFGELLMQGNIVVGAVVFLVLTLVQLIVIAKGAERVAEVSARFTLDALPGKQMSIDADIRSGLLGLEEAKEKRNELQIESRFYGALDGAMKFVKGDAIAGIVITVINILGGFTIGVLLLQLDMGTAINKYTLLTIGDGLLSQVPALLNSIAAGIIVTRVVRDDKDSLATELIQQLGECTKANVIVGLISLLLAAIPGTPAIPFVILSLFLLGSSAISAARMKEEAERPQSDKIFQPKTPPLIEIKIGQKISQLLPHHHKVEGCFLNLLSEVFLQTGLILPMPHFVFEAEEETSVEFLLRGITIKEFVTEETWESFSDTLHREFIEFIDVYKTELVDDALTRKIIDTYDKQAPELIAHLIPNVITITQLSTVIRELFKENVSARNIDVILQTVSENGSKVDDVRTLLEEIRMALGRMITSSYIENQTLSYYRVDPLIDITFANAENAKEALTMEFMQSVRTAIDSRKNRSRFILCVSRRARKLMDEFLKAYNISGIVLAFEEIPDDIKLKEAGMIELSRKESEKYVEAIAA